MAPGALLMHVLAAFLVLVSAAPGGVETAREALLASRGGGERWSEVETLRLEGTQNRNGRINRVVLWRIGPERYRLELAFQGEREVFLGDDERVVRWEGEGEPEVEEDFGTALSTLEVEMIEVGAVPPA